MRRLIVLRPEPGASETAERAREIGLDSLAMPLFEIEPVEWAAPDPAAFDGLLITSANAIRFGGEALRLLRSLPVHAVGTASAAAAREAGFDVASTGEAGVERLLRSIPPDRRLLHLAGVHRTELEVRRPVTAIAVYRSVELPRPAGFGSVRGQAVTLHSARAARRFAQLVDEAGLGRDSVRIAALSPPVAAAAGPGWDRLEAAGEPTDSALLALAARLCEKPVENDCC